MSDTTKTLAQAAQAVLDRWDSPQWKWLKHGPTADLMADLRKALSAAVEADRGPDYGPAWLGAASSRVLAQPEVAARHLREYAELLATSPTASAEPVAKIVSSGQFDFPMLQWLSADHSFRAPIGSILYAAPPAPAVEQAKPTPTLWRVRPLTGGDWTYYDFPPKYALADSTKEVQAFAEVDGKAAPAVEPPAPKAASCKVGGVIRHGKSQRVSGVCASSTVGGGCGYLGPCEHKEGGAA